MPGDAALYIPELNINIEEFSMSTPANQAEKREGLSSVHLVTLWSRLWLQSYCFVLFTSAEVHTRLKNFAK
jgi:hypothetical protein